MPTEEEKEKVFKALVENGLAFIERSAAELATEPTFAIAHFATGLELLLKARLFVEHWTLIATNPRASPWAAVTSGGSHTIQASDLCAAIASVTGTSLTQEKDVFEKVFRHRNRVLHFVPPEDLGEVEAEQCRAWYRLHHLLTVRWQDAFADYKSRVNDVEATLRHHRPYLHARYEAIELKLSGLAKTGVIHKCPACQFESAEMKEGVRAIARFGCDVCGAHGRLARFECGNRFDIYELPATCTCGEEHTRYELFLLLDTGGRSYSPQDGDCWSEPPYCGECLDAEATVAWVGDEQSYVCVACGIYFEPDSCGSCEYCGTRWVGCDLEDPYALGCEFCDGRIDRED